MADPTLIELSLKGPNGPAALSDFAVAIGALRNTVKNVARCVTGRDDIDYEVTGLHFGSAVVDVTPPAAIREVGEDIANLYRDTVEALQDGYPLDPRLDYVTLYAFNGFSSIARNREAALSLTNTPLTKRFAANVAAVLEPDVKSYGSVTGRLERISTHNFTSFTLYPPVPNEAVECVFEREKLEDALRAVDSLVTVYGKMHYVKTKAFPVRCEVETFEAVKLPDTLPTLLNACGLLHSDVPSESLIRELRNEW